ncbi:MAG: hypothetical protein QOH97_4887 [Actinoplanes sp.]|jgi:hypothetical protein|nr:hypothetical protein [Actinoplanes sp.]
MPNSFDTEGPSPADLAAIDAEWPQIQADIDALADPNAVDALVDEITAIERPAPVTIGRHRAAYSRPIGRAALGGMRAVA